MALPAVVRQIHGAAPLTVWTSTLHRTMQTAKHMDCPKLQWKALDELDAGVCDGLTYDEIETQYPEDFYLRDSDKFHFRYRGGESYADLVLRLEPIIMEVERQENIMIIGHQAVLRAILAYFLNKPHDELPYLKIPLHMLIQLTPRAYGCQVTYYRVGIDAVDTYRGRPGTMVPCSPESINIPSPLPVE
jgi:6-phosphofructo-2-kinase/fructose-2,6-biphosphatase 2